MSNKKDIKVSGKDLLNIPQEVIEKAKLQTKNIARFHVFLKENGYSNKTRIIYMKEISFFWDWLEEKYEDKDFLLEDVKLTHAKAYEEYILVEEGLTDNTFNKKRQSLYNFYEFLKEIGEIKLNPFEKITHKRIENRRKTLEYLYKRDFETLDRIFEESLLWKKEHIRLRDKAIYNILKELGLKVQEIVDLQKNDIDRQNMLLHIQGDRKRELEISKELLRVIGDWLEVDTRPDSPYVFTSQKSDKITQNTIHILITKLKEESKIDYLTANILRNTRILAWRREGLGTEEVKRRAGHGNTITTRYYFEKYKRD